MPPGVGKDFARKAALTWQLWSKQDRLFDLPEEMTVDILLPKLIRRTKPETEPEDEEDLGARKEADRAAGAARRKAEGAVKKAAKEAASAGLEYIPPPMFADKVESVLATKDLKQLEADLKAAKRHMEKCAQAEKAAKEARAAAQKERAAKQEAAQLAERQKQERECLAKRKADEQAKRKADQEQAQAKRRVEQEMQAKRKADEQQEKRKAEELQNTTKRRRTQSTLQSPTRPTVRMRWVGDDAGDGPLFQRAPVPGPRPGAARAGSAAAGGWAASGSATPRMGSARAGPVDDDTLSSPHRAVPAPRPPPPSSGQDKGLTKAPDKNLLLKMKDITGDLKDRKLQVLWPDDGTWWTAEVFSVNVRQRKATLVYPSGDKEENLDLVEVISKGEIAFLDDVTISDDSDNSDTEGPARQRGPPPSYPHPKPSHPGVLGSRVGSGGAYPGATSPRAYPGATSPPAGPGMQRLGGNGLAGPVRTGPRTSTTFPPGKAGALPISIRRKTSDSSLVTLMAMGPVNAQSVVVKYLPKGYVRPRFGIVIDLVPSARTVTLQMDDNGEAITLSQSRAGIEYELEIMPQGGR